MTQTFITQKLTSYDIVNSEINQIVNGVVDFANNMGKYFKSSDFSLKKEILQILIPNSFLNEKSAVFSITKPIDMMLKVRIVKYGAPKRSRTPNLLIRSQILYPIEL